MFQAHTKASRERWVIALRALAGRRKSHLWIRGPSSAALRPTQTHGQLGAVSRSENLPGDSWNPRGILKPGESKQNRTSRPGVTGGGRHVEFGRAVEQSTGGRLSGEPESKRAQTSLQHQLRGRVSAYALRPVASYLRVLVEILILLPVGALLFLFAGWILFAGCASLLSHALIKNRNRIRNRKLKLNGNSHNKELTLLDTRGTVFVIGDNLLKMSREFGRKERKILGQRGRRMCSDVVSSIRRICLVGIVGVSTTSVVIAVNRRHGLLWTSKGCISVLCIALVVSLAHSAIARARGMKYM
uniref:PH domain-containing protein n=1 Tax=Amorphochlora amoebiformis TaxID=1561963 RepID=A0A7S0DQI5_9EUKA